MEEVNLAEINSIVAGLRKSFGAGAVTTLDSDSVLQVDVIPTGSLAVDVALGVGGIPRGRVTEIYGPESGGKTTLTLQVIANAQKQGGIAAFIDAEHALDPAYARALGVKTEELIISQPDNGEQALEILEAMIQTGKVAIAVVDSVAALVPRAELEGEMGDAQMGLQARLMSQALRKLTAITGKTNTALIFINQIREKIGVMFGSPETTTGGRALKFYASIRLDVRRIQTLKDGDEKSGNRVKVKVAKNKLAAPFKEAEVDLFFGHGFSMESDLLDLGVKHGFLEKSGSWFRFENENIGQGADKVREFLRENPAVRDQIEMQLRAKLLPGKAKEAA